MLTLAGMGAVMSASIAAWSPTRMTFVSGCWRPNQPHRDDLVGCVIAAHRVDCDANALIQLRLSASQRLEIQVALLL